MREKYLADATLGRLARWLRLLGIDVEYFGTHDHENLVKRAKSLSRKVLTRRRTKISCPVVIIQSDRIEEQVMEFFSSESLEAEREKFFTRCSVCNSALSEVERDYAASSGVPEYILLSNRRFLSCDTCKRIYWPGSHKERFMEKMKRLNIPLRK